MRALKFVVPLALFVVLTWFLLKGLDRDPSKLPSPLIGKPAPEVSVPILDAPATAPWTTTQMRGQVWLLNVWGSWCAGCQVEHPLLNELASSKLAPIIGMAWKDRVEDSKSWLDRLGNPYAIVISDREGRAAIDWGVYGAPETFVIDKAGIVRDKVVGALTAAIIANRLTPLIQRLQAE